jgi:hypothetical protein
MGGKDPGSTNYGAVQVYSEEDVVQVYSEEDVGGDRQALILARGQRTPSSRPNFFVHPTSFSSL